MAKEVDSWSAVTTKLAGSMTPWEPHRTLGFVMDKSGIDMFACKRKKKAYVIRVAYASTNGRKSFSILEQPNGIACVKTTLRGYGKVGTVENLGYKFDVYAKCGRAKCKASSIPKGAIVQSRTFAKGVTVAQVRIRAKGLTYDQVRWITKGLTLVAFN